MRHIESKQEFYKLSRALTLGNILQQWTWEQFRDIMREDESSLPKIVGVRHVRRAFTNKGNSGLMARRDAYQYGLNTSDKENLLFDEGAVHGNITIQGELMPTERGLYLRYSHLQCHQRTLWHIEMNGIRDLAPFQLPHNLNSLTLQQQMGRGNGVVLHAQGLKASAILQKYMDAASWDMVNQILREFVYPVVEFASFNRPIGQLGWNTLFWEVRTKY